MINGTEPSLINLCIHSISHLTFVDSCFFYKNFSYIYIQKGINHPSSQSPFLSHTHQKDLAFQRGFPLNTLAVIFGFSTTHSVFISLGKTIFHSTAYMECDINKVFEQKKTLLVYFPFHM